MEKIVQKIRKKFFADDTINIVDMQIPESNGKKSKIEDFIDKKVDKKYIIKKHPVIHRIYKEVSEKNCDKVALKIRREVCDKCCKISYKEVINEINNKNDITYECKCLVCNDNSSSIIQKEVKTK